MKHLLPIVAALALIGGVGLLVYGFKGGIPCAVNDGPNRPVQLCLDVPTDQGLMAVGAMMITAGAIGLYYRPR